MEVNPKEVGQRIRHIRKEKGLNMPEFGKLIGDTKRSAVGNWERGDNLPNNDRLKRIAELGRISVNELLYGNVENYAYHIITDDINNQGKIWDTFKERYSRWNDVPMEEVTLQTALNFINNNRKEFVHRVIRNIKMAHANSQLNNTHSQPFNIFNQNEMIINFSVGAVKSFLKVEMTFKEYYETASNALENIPFKATKDSFNEIKQKFIEQGFDENTAYLKALDKFYISQGSSKVYNLKKDIKRLYDEYLKFQESD